MVFTFSCQILAHIPPLDSKHRSIQILVFETKLNLLYSTLHHSTQCSLPDCQMSPFYYPFLLHNIKQIYKGHYYLDIF